MRLRRGLAIVGSVLLPGFGHFVLGYRRRAIVWVIGFFVLFPLVVFGLLFTLPFVAFAALLAAIAGWGVMLIDTITRPESADGPPRWPAALVVALVLLIAHRGLGELRTLHSQAFRIPSGSMQPGLLVGDYLYADKLAYRRAAPQRNDLVVHQDPAEPRRTFVKRVIAGPGDTVLIRGDGVYVNSRRLDEPYVAGPHGVVAPGSCRFAYGCEPLTVPSDSYFVLGDNRADSMDSRHWGFVPRSLLIGKARLIYWSWDATRSRARWSRIGARL